MKVDEFIKKVEELGYECSNGARLIKIKDEFNFIYYISKYTLYSIDTETRAHLDNNNQEVIKKLFNLMVEYASTPINEREEEVKYYLCQRPMLTNDGKTVLNYISETNDWFYDNGLEGAGVKTQFAEKQIEDLGYKLNDFAYCVVGTDEWLNK